MVKTEFKLEYQTSENCDELVPVIIVAAGNSSRMNGINKQFLELPDGTPIIARTLTVFQNSPFISKIILVTRDTDIPDMQKICFDYGISKLTDITAGGKDRFSSVLNGIARLSQEDKKVLIHDGARPFTDNFIIGNVCAALQNNPAAICGVPVKDTVKRVNTENVITETPERSSLYAAQTPQGVDVELYRKAAESIKDTSIVTDDASVMEMDGHKVKVVPGSYKNIKITTPEDIALAELLFKGE